MKFENKRNIVLLKIIPLKSQCCQGKMKFANISTPITLLTIQFLVSLQNIYQKPVYSGALNYFFHNGSNHFK
jgi:hypothetical protein